METYNNFEVQYKIKESVKNDNLVINAPDANYCMFSLDLLNFFKYMSKSRLKNNKFRSI